jgi:hypothetical protein
MATVFMKWLETSPKDYDRGIQLLTLGKIQRIKDTTHFQLNIKLASAMRQPACE